MPEKNININLLRDFNDVCAENALPLKFLTVTKERIITPKQPLFWFADTFLTAPPSQLLTNKKKVDMVDQQWPVFVKGIRHLASPFTKFQEPSPDIRNVAADTFLLGSLMSSTFPDSRIVLPKAVGFDPIATYNKSFPMGDFSLEFNMWKPGDIDIQYTESKDGTIGKFNFGLTLNTAQNSRRFALSHILEDK